MAYRIAAIPVTWNDLQGHATNTGFLKVQFLYNYAAVDKISTDIAYHTIPRQ